MEGTRTTRIVCWGERALAAFGIVCLSGVAAQSIRTWAYQADAHRQLAQFRSSSERISGKAGGVADVQPDRASALIGRLEIPRIGLSAVVMEGDDDDTLSLAVGHLPDTPLPWQEGNTVLAGHRDTFFRSLHRLRIGDDIRLETARGVLRYRSTVRTVVEPHELWVLRPSPTAALTLITCYPFSFVGPAPKRFVIHAERVADTAVGTSG